MGPSRSPTLSILTPGPAGAPHPQDEMPALVLTWTLCTGTPGWGRRFREGDARPLTTCPPPAPALGLTSLRGKGEGEASRPPGRSPGQPASSWPREGHGLGPRCGWGVGRGCRLGPISVPLPGETSAGVEGPRVQSPAV